MTDERPGFMEQDNTGNATGFQAEAQAGSQVNQAGESVNLNSITQNSEGNQSQILGKVMDSVVLYVSGGQPIINLAQPGEGQTAEAAPAKKDLGPCPYRGLLAYYEQDSEYYFGRSKEVSRLWERFCELHQGQGKTRFLAIYGPSGSGKSSLARAGLIPALAKQPLQGKDKARVAVMVPGAQPLQKLAAILAQIYQPGLTAFSEARKLARELAIANEAGAFDGLHSFASSMLADIQTVPLVIVVDQFEEVYSLCKDTKERNAFIGNLLYAAAEVSQCVSVVVTFRSDFLGETSQNSGLNRLFSEQGFLAPNMDEAGLREAIAQPAEKAGHPLDEGTIQLLIDQTEGREGALPLLQFALTRIWEGMGQGVEPAKMLKDIGGVGGALAGTAQRIYDGLGKQDQAIASRVFMGLVQLGEGTQDTRRRVPIDDLIASQTEKEQVRRVLGQFTSTEARLITLSSENTQEIAELSHETLIQNWEMLRQWIEQNRDLLRKQRKIEASAVLWKEQAKKLGYLLQGFPLTEAIQFNKQQKDSFPLSDLGKTFIHSSIKSRRWNRVKTASWFIFPSLVAIALVENSIREDNIEIDYGRLDDKGTYIERQAVEALVEGCTQQKSMPWLSSYVSERLFGHCYPLNQAPLEKADLNKANLHSANLNDANLRNAKLGQANLSFADLRNADLRNTNLISANLISADLRNADLRDAYLLTADLNNANLTSAYFNNAHLLGAQFQNAELLATDFRNADLRAVDFSNASLRFTYLQFAYLGGAKFNNTDLRDTKFDDAIVLNTDFRLAKNLTTAQLEGESPPLLCNSPMPTGITIDKNRDCGKLPYALLERHPGLFEDLKDAKKVVDEGRQKTSE